jgi:hypothetical protein
VAGERGEGRMTIISCNLETVNSKRDLLRVNPVIAFLIYVYLRARVDFDFQKSGG